MNHFTDKKGYDGIRATQAWRFRAHQPPVRRHHPFGAYFTTLPPTAKKLAKQLFIPKRKLKYLFTFVDLGDLTPIKGRRGAYIFYHPRDYHVERDRETYHGRSKR